MARSSQGFWITGRKPRTHKEIYTMQPMQAHRILAADILASARAHGTQFYGSGKVFLGTIPAIDLADAECRVQLAELRRMGLLQFARADLVGAMDPALVRCSTWTENLGGHVVETHFLVVE